MESLFIVDNGYYPGVFDFNATKYANIKSFILKIAKTDLELLQTQT